MARLESRLLQIPNKGLPTLSLVCDVDDDEIVIASAATKFYFCVPSIAKGVYDMSHGAEAIPDSLGMIRILVDEKKMRDALTGRAPRGLEARFFPGRGNSADWSTYGARRPRFCRFGVDPFHFSTKT